jgi:flagellar biosynthetic protein FlhB
MAEDLGEKTEAPSSRRLEEARARGQVAKSQDLAGAVELAGGVLAVVLLGAVLARAMTSLLRRALAPAADALTPQSAWPLARAAMSEIAWAMAPVLGLIFLVGVLAHVAQTGLRLSGQPLQPNFSRLNPVAGLGRLFDRRQSVRSAVGIVKLLVVGVISWLFIGAVVPEVASLPRLTLFAAAAHIGTLLLRLVLWLLAVLLVIGCIDWLYQRWQHHQDLRMTKEEVKDERRSMEGDPQVKSRRLRMARQIAMQRIGLAVPKADVIVTNPTHYSVALAYDERDMHAPRVVAKGADLMAMRIRQVAIAHGVPIVERPPLARALYAGVEVGQEVSPEFYQAVAEVLAYVYRLNKEAAA